MFKLFSDRRNGYLLEETASKVISSLLSCFVIEGMAIYLKLSNAG